MKIHCYCKLTDFDCHELDLSTCTDKEWEEFVYHFCYVDNAEEGFHKHDWDRAQDFTWDCLTDEEQEALENNPNGII